MNKLLPPYGRKQTCPCGASTDFHPFTGHESEPAGKCFNAKCGGKFFPPKASHNCTNGATAVDEVREHIYYDKCDTPHMKIVVRKSQGRKNAIAYRCQDGQWLPNVQGVERILYRLPELLESIALDRVIVITEGEKDANSAVSIGLCATTAPFGAGNWKDQYSIIFERSRVVIIQDNDEAGKKHARQVQASLLSAGALSAEILDLTTLDPTLPPKSDLSDYLDRCSDRNVLHREVERLAALPHAEEPTIATLVPPDIDRSALPPLFRNLVEHTDDPYQRIALLSASIVAVGAVLPNVHSHYSAKSYSPCMYLFVLGGPGTGKANIQPAELLLKKINAELVEASKNAEREYKASLMLWKKAGRKQTSPEPEEPTRRQLFIPADATAPLVIRAMCANACCIIFDTECDSLTTAMRSDTGDISSALRKNFQRETVSHDRVGSNINIAADSTHLTFILSGTPDQVVHLVKDVSNGLTSRIAFIELPDKSKFRDPFITTHGHPYDVARQMADMVRHLWAYNTSCMHERSFEVRLTTAQQRKLVAHLSARFNDSIEDADTATTLRSGIIAVRLATVLSCVRVWESTGALAPVMEVFDDDFNTAMKLAEYFRRGTDSVITRLQALRPNLSLPKAKRRTQEWYTSLPAEFSTAEAIVLGAQFGISRSTVLSKLSDEGNFTRVGHGKHRKSAERTVRAP